MSDVNVERMWDAARKLEELGVKQAPAHEADGTRYTTLQDEPGIYYILGIDNGNRRLKDGRGPEDRIQLIYHRLKTDAHDAHADRLAQEVGWTIASAPVAMEGSTDEDPVFFVMLDPPAEKVPLP